ncbi:B12-binding domain-containing radical SAM protein [Pelobacter propionicus]|uniref:Radical SAM domain protein n=1 Tax=Pelobacter propionicus (strain DSM 2379 / NBRC 103807 / OttBd1) TaxID=338966 RepID=A1AMH8_PELPD|nr:cobalamin-dependent protein [Pelobacter propionicus]ABK98548.1 Radical SAM domain protein [Pelobacter propionicus DSM 2379]
MKIKLIYPKWPKLDRQTDFNLPPHGPVCFAATVPADVDLSFTDEHVEPIDFDEHADLVAISCMLTCQMPRGWEIADIYRAKGIPVIFGGIGTMLHAQETMTHADSVFLGEAEGRFHQVLTDLNNGGMQKVYDYQNDLPDIGLVGPARREILNRELYNYRGMQMVDLVHASRGCRFTCFPCCTPFLGGTRFRPRSLDDVIAEVASIENNRLFFVDNSMSQDDQWEKDLFKALIPLKKKWVCHPIKDNDEILDLAAEAGCWYVYQAIFDTSDHIRNRVKRLQERGIGVEGTIILGTDEQDEEYIKRLVDFLLEINLDLAEFTILTPFPHTPIRETLEKEGRILSNDWLRYTGGEVVFQPARMTPSKLQDLYYYAWDRFYSDSSQNLKMAKLFLKVMEKEKADGTYRHTSPRRRKWERNVEREIV